MVESQDQVTKGLDSGAFDADGYIRVDQRMHRLCAPKKDGPMHSFILWTKDSPSDTTPTWDKVVCPDFTFTVKSNVSSY